MRRTVSAVVLAAWALAAALGPVPCALAAPTHPASLGLSLTATPTNGSAPLVVAFHAGVTPMSTTAWFNWTFGDGTQYDQEATGASSPAHSYASAGAYTAQVRVWSSNGTANASLSISVVAENLAATIQATPTSGAAPLTVHFLATLSGGTGTYESILWTFGDGDSGSGPDLNYTYALAGDFHVDLTVTDSSGHSVTAQSSVQVGPADGGNGSRPASPSPWTATLPYLLITAAVLAAAAIAAASYRSLVRRRAGTIEAPAGALVGPASPSVAPEGSDLGEVPGTKVTASGPEAISGPAAAQDESRRLSERLLIHLLWYGRPNAEGVARVEASQQGMARALAAGQNTISKALSRLIDAGAVRSELNHVPGAPRRVKTYSLTPRGEAVARSLTRGPGDPNRRGPR